ncbi:hypothetical protein [Candidatus Uabimicrobium sp. HlEnr_7]|uniref:hypothetical protein n=1 Tax=Candidatus Uabimicrobium helgolandensis TaxID=3095367 RepID=UPI00355829D5
MAKKKCTFENKSEVMTTLQRTKKKETRLELLRKKSLFKRDFTSLAIILVIIVLSLTFYVNKGKGGDGKLNFFFVSIMVSVFLLIIFSLKGKSEQKREAVLRKLSNGLGCFAALGSLIILFTWSILLH